MALTFTSPQLVVDLAMSKLKSAGLVHSEAKFNRAAHDGLRKEVAYRDRDFLRYLGGEGEVEAVSAALEFLKSHGHVDAQAAYDEAAFEALRHDVKANFERRWTSITPVMERLLYMLTSVRRPNRLVEFGCFWGNTLAWYVGPCIGAQRAYEAEVIYANDMDGDAIELARRNLAKIANTDRIELIAEDARGALDHLPGPFDSVYLEAKSAHVPGMYLILLKRIYDKLPKGAWVLAHDPTDPDELPDLVEYLEWVRDPSHFAESICFDVDACGLELSIK